MPPKNQPPATPSEPPPPVILPPDEAAVQTPDPTSTGPGMFKNPSGKTGTPPPAPPVAAEPAPGDKFTPVSGNLFLNLNTGALHKAQATTRLVFKANGEPEWDDETGEQKVEEIPVAEQVPGTALEPFRFNAVKLDKGLGNPIPGTMQEYEHPRGFPRAKTVESLVMLIGAAYPVLTLEVRGDMDTPESYKDRVYVLIYNAIQTNGPKVEFEIGELAISLMTDPNAAASKEQVKARLDGWLAGQGVSV